MQLGFWRMARITLVGAGLLGLLVLAVFLALAGLMIAEGQGELFVRASVGVVVSATMVWLLGQAARQAGYRATDLLITRWTAAIRDDPPDVAGHLQRAIACAQRREFAKAIAHLDVIIDVDPDEPNAHVGRVNAYIALGQLERVIVHYTEAIELDATDAVAHGARATAYNAAGQFDLAIADATTAIVLAPALYLGYDARGYAYWQRGNFNWLLRVIGIAWILATFGLWRRDRFDWRMPTGTRADHEQAVADFTEALRLNPAARDCYASRAMAYRALGEHAKAAVDEALRAAPLR
jgi:tetratricopeptide (TPR) repeat protein